MKHLLRFAIGSILAGCISVPSIFGQAGRKPEDNDVLSRSIRQSYREKKEDGLNIVVYLIKGSQETPVDPRVYNFKKGDEIRIEFRSNFDGYVYFVNIDPFGEKTVIYPDLKKEKDNLIRADRTYRLPTDTIFKFEEELKGTETIQVIMSRQPVAFLEDAIRNYAGGLGKTGSNAASELGGFVVGKTARVLPENDAVRQRTIRLAPPYDKDKEGAVVTVSDKQLKPGEVAVFDIYLRRS